MQAPHRGEGEDSPLIRIERHITAYLLSDALPLDDLTRWEVAVAIRKVFDEFVDDEQLVTDEAERRRFWEIILGNVFGDDPPREGE